MITNETKLDLTQSSDFQYLLELMLPLSNDPAYAWLPELFSVIGHEKLILLCKFCGGETIRIPKLEELMEALDALDWYYKVHIAHCKYRKSIPERLVPKVEHIKEIIDARDS